MLLSLAFPVLSILHYYSLKQYIIHNSNTMLERGKLDKMIAKVHKDAGTNRSSAQMEGTELIPFFTAGPDGGGMMNPAINRMYTKCGFESPGKMIGKEFVMGLFIPGDDGRLLVCGNCGAVLSSLCGCLLYPCRAFVKNLC